MKRLTILIAILVLSSCSGAATGMFGSRNLGPSRSVDLSVLPTMRVANVVVTVPDTLVVSESNDFKPVADIVWRGDPVGDRHEQVKIIVENAITKGASRLAGAQSVNLAIEVARFHGVTERTRYSVGGVHEIDLLLTVTNAQSGEIMVPQYLVKASLPAFGGDEALAAERIGLTQKVRISEHLARIIQIELTGVDPGVADLTQN